MTHKSLERILHVTKRNKVLSLLRPPYIFRPKECFPEKLVPGRVYQFQMYGRGYQEFPLGEEIFLKEDADREYPIGEKKPVINTHKALAIIVVKEIKHYISESRIICTKGKYLVKKVL